jgi:uncharacterized membrane protein YdjX (TVP38/TMEM64 family)
MVLLLVLLPTLAQHTPAEQPLASAAVIAVVVVAIGTAVLPPTAAALGAGYCLGAMPGTWAAVLGVGLGCLLARALALRFGARLLPALRERPRAVAVRAFVRGPAAAATLAVARLRWAAVFPFAATNLLFAVVALPARCVLLGSWIAALPPVLLGAVAGDGLRTWREGGGLPGTRTWLVAAAAMVGSYMLRRASRRAWRAATAPDA